MDPKDERLEPVMNFAMKSFRLEPNQWRSSISDDESLVTLNSFFTGQDYSSLFICQEPTDKVPPTSAPRLRFSLGFPRNVSSKVVSVSKPSREAVTKDSAKNLLFVELTGDDALSLITVLTEEMALTLLGSQENSCGWPEGMLAEVLRHMELQKNQALVLKAQTQGRTFLPQPGLKKDSPNSSLQQGHDLETENTSAELLQACDLTIIEWAELVGEFLKQDSSELLLEQTRPLPKEEFNFWESRLQNLTFIDQQLKSSKAQRVAAIVQKAESVYASTLEQTCSSVQYGLMEAEDITKNLKPIQELLDQVQKLDYPKLKDQVQTVMEEVCLVCIRSRFYCKPSRVVVMLQEICNLFIHLSRVYLGQGRVMRGLVVDPAPVLDAVCLCIDTLERIRERFRRCRAQLESHGGNCPKWDFPSKLIFVHLDLFLQRLESIREVYRVTLDFSHLDQTVLSGINSKKSTSLIQEVYDHFLKYVTTIAESKCDPTDPADQVFPELYAWFHSQVRDVESHLVTVFSQAFETCTSSTSAAKTVQMFELVLCRPLILEHLRCHFKSVWDMIQAELEQTEITAQNQIRIYKQSQDQNQVYSGFKASAVSALIWSQQLELRVQDTFTNQKQVRAVDSSGVQAVTEKYHSLIQMLEDFRNSVRTEWSQRLEEDSAFLLKQPVIQLQKKGSLEVPCGSKLEELLRELRFVTREKEITLRPRTAQMFTNRDAFTDTHLSLSTLQSCYNSVVNRMEPVEQPLIQDQLQDLNQGLSELQSRFWRADGLLQEVQKHKDKVQSFYQKVTEARAKTAAIKQIIEGWGQIQLLQREKDGLLRGGASMTGQLQLSQDAKELLTLTWANMRLYSAQETSKAWLSYLDYIDDMVRSGLVQLLTSALTFLTRSMKSPGPPLLSVTLVLEAQGSRFIPSEPSKAGTLSVEQCLSSILSQLYSITDVITRVSTHRTGNYSSILKKHPSLLPLQQEVETQEQEVAEKAECLRAELDRKYSHLWTSNKEEVMREFQTYGRQLGPNEVEVIEAPPTLKEYKRELQSVQSLQSVLSAIDDVTVLQGWLQVDLRPFRASVMSLSDQWSQMFTWQLLQTAKESLRQVAPFKEDEPETTFPLTQTVLLLEASGVELPPELSKHIHC